MANVLKNVGKQFLKKSGLTGTAYTIPILVSTAADEKSSSMGQFRYFMVQ